MRKYILNTNILYYASRLNEKDSYAALVGNKFKTANTQNKSSKVNVQYESITDEIHLYKKPRCCVEGYIDNKEFNYVGVLNVDWTITEEDYDEIRKLCKDQNIIPIFSEPGEFGEMIQDILEGNTFEYTYLNLDHATIYKKYCDFNNEVIEALSDLNETDFVWAQDYNFIHAIAKYKNTVLSIRKFNELWKCIPFCEKLLDDIMKLNTLDFQSEEDLNSFKLFISYTYFPEYKTLPNLIYLLKGIDISYISNLIYDTKVFEKNSIIVPYDSIHHLICLDKFINKYTLSTKIYLLNLNTKKISQEVLNYINYLNLKTTIEIASPLSDEDFYSLLSKCHIGFYKSLNNYFHYFKSQIIENSCYDYDKVADEIYKKLHFKNHEDILVSDLKEDIQNLLDRFEKPNLIETKNEKIELSGMSHIGLETCKKDSVTKEIVFDSTSINDEENNNNIDCVRSNKSCTGDISRCASSNNDSNTDSNTSCTEKSNNDSSRNDNSKRDNSNINYSKGDNTSCTDSNTSCTDNKTNAQSDQTTRLLENTNNSTKIQIDSLPLNKINTIILDYDGTIVPICDNPQDAILSEENKKLLTDLNKHYRLVIVSGRSKKDMDKFIPSKIEVFAEHCSFRRKDSKWTQIQEKSDFELEYSIAKFYEDRTPGSSLEKKINGFVFHYRNCDSIYALPQAKKLYTDLIKVSNNIKLGNNIIEYKTSTKQDIFKYCKDFSLICGDDTTDEDMFDNSKGLTVKIGKCSKTKAAYYVNSVNDLLEILRHLLKTQSSS